MRCPYCGSSVVFSPDPSKAVRTRRVEEGDWAWCITCLKEWKGKEEIEDLLAKQDIAWKKYEKLYKKWMKKK